MKTLLKAFITLTIAITGCAPVISEQSRRLVNTDAPFQTIREKPADYTGKYVMLGGRIVNLRNSDSGAQLEVVQFELTPTGAFDNSYLSYGRFLATCNSFLEPLLFGRGRMITMVGEITGRKVLRLDDMDYSYPVIAMKEWYLWQDSGLESGYIYPAQMPQYDPYNYGYGYEPFLLRPGVPGNIAPLRK